MEPFERFEEAWSKWAGVNNVVGCSSGTAALHLALEAMRLPLGSEVIVPDYSMVACARAVVLAGHTPVFCDVTPDRLVLCPEPMETCITDKTRAVIAVASYGRMVNMPAVSELAEKYSLKVIEDLAEAHGVPPHPNTDAACWSFYKNKIIAGEEGGAVSFKNIHHAARAKSLRSIGFTPEHNYTHIPRGHNYRLSNAHATLILDSIASTHDDGARRLTERIYDQAMPVEWRMPRRDAVWVYDFRIPGLTETEQAGLVGQLQATGLAARYGFRPLSSQEEFRGSSRVPTPNSYQARYEVVSLPILPAHRLIRVGEQFSETPAGKILRKFKS